MYFLVLWKMKSGKIIYFVVDLILRKVLKLLIEYFDYKLGGNNVEEVVFSYIGLLLGLYIEWFEFYFDSSKCS